MLKKTTSISLAFIAAFALYSGSFFQPGTASAVLRDTRASQVVTPTYYCGGSSSCITTSPSAPSLSGNNTISPAPCVHKDSSSNAVRNNNNNFGNSSRGGPLQLLEQLLTLLLQLLGFGQFGTPAIPAPVGNPPNNPSISSSPLTNPSPTTPCPPVVSPVNNPVPSVATTISTAPPPVSSSSGGKTVAPAPEQGSNYAGYSYNDAQSVANDTVEATWTAVTTQCSPNGIASPWVGMGDNPDSENNLAQLGIDIDCKGASPVYKPWTEALPASLVYTNNPVKAGDVLTARVTYQGSGKFTTTMSDKNQGWVINMPMNYASSYVPQGGEAIVETAADGGGKAPKYATITFTNFLFSKGSTTQLQPVSVASGIKRFSMTNGTTSALTGSTFTVTY